MCDTDIEELIENITYRYIFYRSVNIIKEKQKNCPRKLVSLLKLSRLVYNSKSQRTLGNTKKGKIFDHRLADSVSFRKWIAQIK